MSNLCIHALETHEESMLCAQYWVLLEAKQSRSAFSFASRTPGNSPEDFLPFSGISSHTGLWLRQRNLVPASLPIQSLFGGPCAPKLIFSLLHNSELLIYLNLIFSFLKLPNYETNCLSQKGGLGCDLWGPEEQCGSLKQRNFCLAFSFFTKNNTLVSNMFHGR